MARFDLLVAPIVLLVLRDLVIVPREVTVGVFLILHGEGEADVLTPEADRKAKIDYAKELGDVVVHFTKDTLPVLVEILNASRVLKQKGLVGKV